jgi:hypothetical protein
LTEDQNTQDHDNGVENEWDFVHHASDRKHTVALASIHLATGLEFN